MSTFLPKSDASAQPSAEVFVDPAQAILDGIKDPIFVKDLSGCYLNVNEACLRALGKPLNALIGHDDSSLFPPETAEALMRADRRVLDHGDIVETEDEIRTVDGLRTFHATRRPYRNAEGRIIGVIGVARDITEIRREDKIERERESLFREMAEHMREVCWIVNVADASFLYVSPSYEGVWGKSCDLICEDATEWENAIHPDDREEAVACFRRALSGAPYDQEYRILRDASEVAWIHDRGSIVPDDEGRPLHLVGMAEDVTQRRSIEASLRRHEEQLEKIVRERTLELQQANAYLMREIEERKKAEASLRQSEAHLRALFAGIDDMMFVYDYDGRILECNEAVAERLNYTRDALLGTSFLDIAEPGFATRFQARLQSMVEHRGYHFEGALISKSGRQVPIDMMTSTLDYHGQHAVIGLVRDITDRKAAEGERRQLEQQVQHTQKLESLGVLAGGIAHDFNNLLMGILGNVEMSLEGVKIDSDLFAELNEIQKSAKHAADLCRQMLAYSGKGQFVTEPLNLSHVVTDISSLLDASVSKSCSLEYDLMEVLPPIEADAVQMRQILLNLITNASEAIGGAGGRIAVRTTSQHYDAAFFERSFLGDHLSPGTYVGLEVSDTGCGMDSETLDRIFDPFFTTKFTGRGLGLAAVLGIIRGHKGTVRVRSILDEGTTFTMLFPVTKKAVPEIVEGGSGGVGWSGGGSVLLVDDEASVRGVGKRMLERAGFDVLTAEDGLEGVDLLREHNEEIVCVLLDLTMPQMDGEETYREMRKIRDDLPVIISSGYDEQDVIARFGPGHQLVFLQKPYEKLTLMAKISEVLTLDEPMTVL